MTKIKHSKLPGTLLAFLLLSSSIIPVRVALAAEEDHQGEEHEEGGAIEMSAAERQANSVTTGRVEQRQLSQEAVVPGEVTIDMYRSAQITPRISAQIVERHARLGDVVKKGQAIVTLSSVDMAAAQGQLIVTTREWQRVKGLGRDVVSERRYVEAQVAAELARATVLAYGLTAGQADDLAEQQDASQATGLFDLLAPQDGTVISDDFIIGEVVQPGRILFEMTDDSRLWVKAQLAPEQAADAEIGAPVRVLTDDGKEVPGKIVQIFQMLDETTRTLPVRIEIANETHRLRSGQFVTVVLAIDDGSEVMAIPSSAVILMDGRPTVFKVEDDELHPTEIDAGETRSGWTEVKGGLTRGDEIATSEIFLLKSLIQKSQMGEGHGH